MIITTETMDQIINSAVWHFITVNLKLFTEMLTLLQKYIDI